MPSLNDDECVKGAQPPSAAALFVCFSRIGLQGFGGVLPFVQREVVAQRRWLTQQQFTELLGMGAALPGPNVCNFALMFGWRCSGGWGALSALAGLLLGPAVLLLGVFSAIQPWLVREPLVRAAVDGMACASAGLVLASATRMFKGLQERWLLGAAAVLSLVLVAWLQWPVIAVLPGVGVPTWLWLYRRALAQARGSEAP